MEKARRARRGSALSEAAPAACLALQGLGSPELMADLVYFPNFRRQCLP